MINHRLKKCVIAAAFAGLGAGAGGIAMADNVELGTITVKGEGMREADRSFTINTIDQDRIGSQRWENTLSILEQVPGFDAHAYQHGGVADSFSIRGFPSGGHGSDAGMVLDGISLNEGESHSDGYGDTSVIMPIEIESAQVYKGPVSPLYGNFARSGVVAFNTRKGGEYTDIHLGMGSYETYDAQAAFGMSAGPLQLNGAMQGFSSEGWRDHSEYNKVNAAFRANYAVSDRTDVALSLRGHGSRWNAPNYITHEQFVDNDRRRQENPFTRLQEDEGSKQFDAQRLDLNHTLSDDLRILAWAWRTTGSFTRYQTALNAANAAAAVVNPATMTAAERLAFMDPFAFDANNPSDNIRGVAPQRVQTHDRDATAIGASLNGTKPVVGIASNWVVGLEYYDEDVDRERWETVNRERFQDTATFSDEYNIKSLSLYGQIDLDVHPLFRPTLGFRYDDFSGDRLDRLTGQRTDMNSYDHFSPKLGVRSAIHDNWELRASISNGFALPQGNAKYDPALNVDTVEFWQYEIGINGAPTPEWYLDLVAFMLNTTDEIMEIAPLDFQNFGETTRTGIEGEVRYFPAAVPNLEAYTSFGLFDSEIDKHVNTALVGNTIPRMASHIATVGVRYTPPVGWGGSLNLRSVGSWYTDDANTVEYDGHEVLNGSVFYVFRTEAGRSGRVYLDVNNILDEEYSQYVAGAFNGNPASYSPRPPTNVMLGFMMSM